MRAELALVLGVVFAALSLPVLLNALVERRAPQVSTALFFAGAGLMGWALWSKPALRDLHLASEAVIDVIARVLP
ncbi:hypothetical protein SAMN05421688_2371 [Poseidonocella pacifica]|uniref:Uncharacterized protein n=1 Tax=Poseidonocella pacifica TaxID=871651 RepID=A0A1I0XJX3_9RHOB|nr:hypothetical protein [Poseidonocella pacifica]SFB01312.1 hypothetical protein SAMN05421688_2371 [Poseidonocella pacifica]